MKATITKTTSGGAKITVTHSACFLDKSADGQVYGSEFFSSLDWIQLSKDGKDLLGGKEVSTTLPGLPSGAVAALRNGNKAQPISQETFDLINMAKEEAKEAAEKEFGDIPKKLEMEENEKIERMSANFDAEQKEIKSKVERGFCLKCKSYCFGDCSA